MIFEINTKLPTLNSYIKIERGNKFAASKLKKLYTNLCATYAKKVKDINHDALYDLEIIWNVEDNKCDPDNVFFAVKFILDGIVKAKILDNDGRRNIRHISHKIFTAKKYKIIVKFIASTK